MGRYFHGFYRKPAYFSRKIHYHGSVENLKLMTMENIKEIEKEEENGG
jgi:hypothetical protein